MNDLVKQNDDLMVALKNSLYPHASDESIGMVLSYCRAAGLDPMQKPVHIVPMWDSKSRSMRDVVMPGIGLYRIQAARSGAYAGVSEPVFSEDVTEKIGGVEITYPLSCRVTVKKIVGNNICEFTATEFWKENYAKKGGQDKSIAPNAMWEKRPYGQIAKCAEAQALRKAFPELGSMPTFEEMEGKNYIDAEVIPKPEIKMPHAKSPIGLSDAPIDPVASMDIKQGDRPMPEQQPAKPEAGGVLSPGQVKVIIAKTEYAGLVLDDVLKQFGVTKIGDLNASQINDVLDWIKNHAGA